MDLSAPYKVADKVKLMVMNATDGLPAAFALMGTLAERKVAMRLAGGCKGQDSDDKKKMIDFFSDVYGGFRGLIFSGATRSVNDEMIDPMITDIPGVIAAENKGCIALGTAPRTAMMTLQDDSRLVLDEWGTGPNPDMSGILIVQNGADGVMNWDGDLEAYFTLMQNWQRYAGFTQLGLCAWNGGDITRDEIIRAANLKWPVFLITGSGRVTDEVADQLFNDDDELLSQIPVDHNMIIAYKEDPEHLRGQLRDWTFLE